MYRQDKYKYYKDKDKDEDKDEIIEFENRWVKTKLDDAEEDEKEDKE